MIAAPSLESITNELQCRRTPIIGLVFAPPFTKIGIENLLSRLNYLDERSGKHIHFFLAGYGAYNFAPDAKSVDAVYFVDGDLIINWQFSERSFAHFVDELEERTKWKYSGEADVILTDGWLSFEESIVFDLESMVRDGAIDKPSGLFEAIIRYAKERGYDASAYNLSDKRGIELLGEFGIESILELLPAPGRKLWKKGLHYRIRNLSRGGPLSIL